ncbi:hypothetical protein [Hungatella effluvii]|uniref:hypothetical protein n=1 Tax=Hungatella effluvii TaxID=1096246 RepID=UPI0022E0AF88|nr:hypothetical protein [Hungatella effluvii]
MKIYEVIAEKDVKFIEQTLMSNWETIQKLSSKICDTFNEDRNKPFDYSSSAVKEFKKYCISCFDFLFCIDSLLTIVVRSSTNDIERIILKKLIDFIDDRLTSIKLMLEILDNKESANSCNEIARFISELIWDMDTKL